MNCTRRRFFSQAPPAEVYASAEIVCSTMPPADRNAAIVPTNPVLPKSATTTPIITTNKSKEKKKTNLRFFILRNFRNLLHTCRNRKSPLKTLINRWNHQIRSQMCVLLLPGVCVQWHLLLQQPPHLPLGSRFRICNPTSKQHTTPTATHVHNSLSMISLSGAQYVGNLTYLAGVLCKQMIGMYFRSFSSTEILEKSDDGSKFMMG